MSMKPALKKAIKNALDCYARGKPGTALKILGRFFRYNGPGENDAHLRSIKKAVKVGAPSLLDTDIAHIDRFAAIGSADYFSNNRCGKADPEANGRKAGEQRHKLKGQVPDPMFNKGQVVQGKKVKTKGVILGTLNGNFADRILKQGYIYIVQTSAGRIFVKEADLELFTANRQA